jgi:hypothetical protein
MPPNDSWEIIDIWLKAPVTQPTSVARVLGRQAKLQAYLESLARAHGSGTPL